MNVTVAEIAERLDIPVAHVSSWAAAWHGRLGTGNRRVLTTTDILVARAWYEIGGAWAGHGPGRTAANYGRANGRQRRAETAIRANPRRWLLIAGDHTETHDTAETAAQRWLDSDQPAGQIIDLWSVPEPAGV